MGAGSTPHLYARRWTAAGLTTGAAVAVAAATVVGVAAPGIPSVSHAAVRLLDTTIGVGGSFDGLGLGIPMFFYGTAVRQGDSFHVVPYPAQINVDWPVISDLPGVSDLPYWPHSLKQSERIGAGFLEQDIASQAPDQKISIIGMSQGAQVAEIARADMAKNPDYVVHAGDYTFAFVGDPYQPNGGILSRFTAWNQMPILGDLIPFGRPGPADSPFQTTVYQNQYDGFADFPAYFNPLAIVNAAMGIVFQHVFPGYVLEPKSSPNTVTTTVGNTTYVTYPQRLPLLAPLHFAASLIGVQRIVDALDPVLRVLVESGYDRTADPSRVQEFSWTMPQDKINAAIEQLPGAFAQSWEILRTGAYTPTLPQPIVDPTGPATPTTDHPARPVTVSPVADAIRQWVVNVTAALANVTRPLANLMQIISGQKPLAATPPALAARPRPTLSIAASPAAPPALQVLPAPTKPTTSGQQTSRRPDNSVKRLQATQERRQAPTGGARSAPDSGNSGPRTDDTGRRHESGRAATGSSSRTATKAGAARPHQSDKRDQ